MSRPAPALPRPALHQDVTAPAAALYPGVVMHARLTAPAHRFTYHVASLAIDIDRLQEVAAASPLFSVGRLNLFSFFEADHGSGDGTALRPWIDRLLSEAGVDTWSAGCKRAPGETDPQPACPRQMPAGSRQSGQVVLLCYPRILGYVFNPLSVYFCYRPDGTLAALVYEVRNTFGERHAYVAPVRDGEASVAGIRQEVDKLFHVSPFLGMALRYKFRIRPPAETVALRILECDGSGPVLAATFSGRRAAFDTRTLLRVFGRLPLQSLKIIAGIHWEALKLWFKGARYHRRPAAPAHASLDGRMLGER